MKTKEELIDRWIRLKDLDNGFDEFEDPFDEGWSKGYNKGQRKVIETLLDSNCPGWYDQYYESIKVVL